MTLVVLLIGGGTGGVWGVWGGGQLAPPKFGQVGHCPPPYFLRRHVTLHRTQESITHIIYIHTSYINLFQVVVKPS